MVGSPKIKTHRLLIGFIILAVFTSAAVYAANDKLNRRAERSFSKAQKLEKENKNTEALAEYEKILKNYPGSVKVLERTSYLYMLANNAANAEKSAQAAIKTGENCPISSNIMGMLMERRGQLGQAERLYTKALESDPLYAGAYNNLGNIFLKKADFKKAEENYKKATELDGKNPLFYNNLAYSQELAGNVDGAEKNYLKALELNASFKKAEENLSNLRNNQNPRPTTDDEKKIAGSICKIKPPADFRFLGAFKSEDGSRTAIYDYKKRQRFILKQLPKNNAFNETIFSQMVFEHKQELSKMLKDITDADDLNITGQGYINTGKLPVLYISSSFQKNNIPFDGVFSIISRKNPDKHVMLTVIVNKGLYSRGATETFIKNITSNI